MTRKGAGLIESVKDSVVSAIEGSGQVSGALVDAVSRTVAKSIEGFGGIATSLVSPRG